MYHPVYTCWNDRSAALALAREYNFAALITVVGGGPVVTHLPFLIDEKRNVLRGHFARANPHSTHIDSGRHLVVFTGPYAYISPDWYGRAENDVPTWNYLAVHIVGAARVLGADGEIDAFLTDLSAFEEARRPDLGRGGKIWTMDKIAPKDHARMRAAIVAFEINIETVEAKAKLNQNKPQEALKGVIKALSESGSERGEAVAKAMRAAKKPR